MSIKSMMIIFTLFVSSEVIASNGKCTEWTKTRGVSCIYAGRSANVYERQCENYCWRGRHNQGNWGPDCDRQRVCHFNDPDTFQDVCSEWIKQSGTSCRNPNTGDWEQKWVRACTVGLREDWCSDSNPNEN